MAQAFPTTQFRDAAEALALLRNCIALLENAVMTGRGLTVAVGNCQASARLAEEGLSPPLAGGEELELMRRAPRELPEAPSITLPDREPFRSAPRLTEHLAALMVPIFPAWRYIFQTPLTGSR